MDWLSLGLSVSQRVVGCPGVLWLAVVAVCLAFVQGGGGGGVSDSRAGIPQAALAHPFVPGRACGASSLRVNG